MLISTSYSPTPKTRLLAKKLSFLFPSLFIARGTKTLDTLSVYAEREGYSFVGILFNDGVFVVLDCIERLWKYAFSISSLVSKVRTKPTTLQFFSTSKNDAVLLAPLFSSYAPLNEPSDRVLFSPLPPHPHTSPPSFPRTLTRLRHGTFSFMINRSRATMEVLYAC